MNIIEAVKYLRAHPEAIITRSDRPDLQLMLSGIYVKIKNHDGTIDDFKERYDFVNEWIHQGNAKPHRTHAEIMRNWFKKEYYVWEKVTYLNRLPVLDKYYIHGDYRTAEYFDSCEMKTQEEIEAMEFKI